MDITVFIRELLFGHDCVIIPGFGGFIGNYSPARIDKSSGKIFPPVKQISFNRNLNHNDGLLIKQITGSTLINYGDARSLVEEFVLNIRRKLEKGEKVVFEKIGTFVNNDEGNIQFEPETGINYHLDSFGLESFQCFPLEAYDVRKKIAGHVQKHPVRQHSFRKYLWRAAVIIPLAAAVVTVSLKTDFFRSRVEATTMNPLVNAEFEHNKTAVDQGMAADSQELAKPVADLEEVVAETVTKPTSELVPEPPVNTANETSSLKAGSVKETAITETSSYYVVTGSFQSEDNAGKQVIQLQAEGFNPRLISSGNGFYRVCALVCPDLQTAIQKKDSIAKKFPGSWVSKKK
jgi:nucleoid DNA-binding protein/cell division septation protein DedD